MSELRRWMGADHVPSARGSGYRLASTVTSDWDEFRSLVSERHEEPQIQAQQLAVALSLVRGRPFAGTNYRWVDAELLVSEMEVAIADVARRLEAVAASLDGNRALYTYLAGWRGALACPYDLGLWKMALVGAAEYDSDALAKTWREAQVALGDEWVGLQETAQRLDLV
jgi:hypothetical protein